MQGWSAEKRVHRTRVGPGRGLRDSALQSSLCAWGLHECRVAAGLARGGCAHGCKVGLRKDACITPGLVPGEDCVIHPCSPLCVHEACVNAGMAHGVGCVHALSWNRRGAS
eukprot:1158416-Pelagomonas_calceolata.AAC.1